ncbi:SDR family NAD(P)-dependent oxidoreductase [Pseudomonas sp. N040]|uniref:SDR family NAD(P)-dependent oxidoreductase n=1 Tax=Pseudomonas sp. N040 TaxID=2785325 RepID=UPI0018A32AB6|nr:SDR family NAD(P)-dependent oxidoreductase [Pseudomonas sp. N040]MBF7729230.1 SDR family NAD(P)-dependent oxidoreductase [Pseudomonas sp. N040]MBW7012870.1 SDR family NAD(P)-dependent oxidoreductase [Pseudomonas sp. N040]
MNKSSKPTIVITGASSGIGRELALEMARRGHNLGLTARRLPLLEELREEIHSTINNKLKVELAILDVCQTDTVSPALQTLFTRLGGVDSIVVNAGVNDMTDIGGGTNDLAKELNLITTNLSGAIATVAAAAEHFITRGKGHVIGISSLASLQPMTGQAAYCASKAGFSMYLKAARIELRAKGITVTSILPGYIATDIVEGVDISKMPFAIPASQAAREMADLIEKKVESGVVPAFPWKLVKPFLGHLPERFAHY